MSLHRMRDVGPLEPPVTVVGDVHLAEDRPDVTDRFLAFLEEVAPGGGTLVLLGDLFDWWVGRRQAAQPFARRILDALARVADAGVRLAFVAGNRDFAFDGAPGLAVALWPDVVRARWGRTTVVLSHGDLHCTADRGYQALRRLLRAWPTRTAMRALPFGLAARLARGLRSVSERHGRRRRGARLGIDYGEADTWLAAYGADLLVLGHVHTGVHHVRDGPRPGAVIVLKDWDASANGVRFDDDAGRAPGDAAIRPWSGALPRGGG